MQHFSLFSVDDDDDNDDKDDAPTAAAYLDRLGVENFVCPPRANRYSASSNRSTSVTRIRPNLAAIFAYLEPTLISSASAQADDKPAPTTAATATKLVEANEGKQRRNRSELRLAMNYE